MNNRRMNQPNVQIWRGKGKGAARGILLCQRMDYMYTLLLHWFAHVLCFSLFSHMFFSFLFFDAFLLLQSSLSLSIFKLPQVVVFIVLLLL